MYYNYKKVIIVIIKAMFFIKSATDKRFLLWNR